MMTNFFPLPIFPYAALSSSVITTVWVGVFVIAFFNLRFGWVLSGLVIPGYLIPLILLKPVSVVVIIIEAILTYLLVWLFSEYSARWHHFNHLFGRDRFFALFLTSVLVRVCMDGWILPELGQVINQHFQVQLDYHSALHSFGLIIVALISNLLWKNGLARGLVQVLVTLAITYFLVRFVLMTLTNFEVSNLQYMYENIATSMLASPKSYIILIITAFIASKMNLYYGWEYNGILIPALLALQWYQPIKIFSSFLEAFIILGGSVLLMQLPFFKHKSIEGAYKILLFFNVGFLYKFLLGYFSFYFYPNLTVTDFYGFGYLLSTLIAIKMDDKRIYAHLPMSTLQTSVLAIFVATFAGYAMSLLPPVFFTPPIKSYKPPVLSHLPETLSLQEAMNQMTLTIYQNKIKNRFVPPSAAEKKAFVQAIKSLLAQQSTANSPELKQAQKQLALANYSLKIIQSRYFLLQSPIDHGWGIYLIDTQSDNKALVEVPDPLGEPNALLTGVALYSFVEAKALAVAGSAQNEAANPKANVLRNYNTFYQIFHRIVQNQNVLQIRTTTAEPVDKPMTEIRIKESLPPILNLSQLKGLVGNVTFKWNKPEIENFQRDTTSHGFAELIFNQKAVGQLLTKLLSKRWNTALIMSPRSIEGYLLDKIHSDAPLIAPKGSNQYVSPTLAELLFFDKEVLTPLLQVAAKEYSNNGWTKSGTEQLQIINSKAAAIGYQVIRYHHLESNQNYLLLIEIPHSANRHFGGTFVFRLGSYEPYIIQVPRPLFETNSFEYGTALFELLNAKALIFSGTHPYANTDQTSDVLNYFNRRNFFNLVTQVILRESGKEPLMIVQSRTFGIHPQQPAPRGDILVSFGDGVIHPSQFSVLDKNLLDRLKAMGLNVKIVGGSEQTAGYEASGAYPTSYFDQVQSKFFATVWLSPTIKSNFRHPEENELREAKFNAIGISTIERGIYPYLESLKRGYSNEVPKALRATLKAYIDTQDIVLLHRLNSSWPDYHFQRVVDINSKQPYLFVFNSQDQVLLVAHLAATDLNAMVAVNAQILPKRAVHGFIESRATWLELESGQ